MGPERQRQVGECRGMRPTYTGLVPSSLRYAAMLASPQKESPGVCSSSPQAWHLEQGTPPSPPALPGLPFGN